MDRYRGSPAAGAFIRRGGPGAGHPAVWGTDPLGLRVPPRLLPRLPHLYPGEQLYGLLLGKLEVGAVVGHLALEDGLVV